MTTRSIRLVAYLTLLALGSGVSFASSGPVNVPAGNLAPAAFCPTNVRTYSRIAQFGHCYCCGRDQYGHCNHQCCN